MYKCASFCAGVGGIDLGFKSDFFDIIYANDIEKLTAVTLEENFPKLKVDVRDVTDVKSDDIPSFDIMLAGFPCQAFSIAGYRKGFNDEQGRGTIFFELARIIEKKKPKVVFLENVKNLVGHDNGNTFRTIIATLESLGYHVKYQVLNAINFGNIPQNRERIYIVAFKNKKYFNNFEFPKPLALDKKLGDVINYTSKVDDKYYYTSEKCQFYTILKNEMKNKNSIYQWRRQYVRENKSNACPTLTANMGTGGHNVPLISTSYGIRKLTPRECFNLQGFPSTFILPEKLSDTTLYKQAGNSVVVTVIRRIAQQIRIALSV